MDDHQIARVAVPRRDIPGEHPEVARLCAMVIALLGELAVTRERLDTVERVADEAGAFDRLAVETYRATGPAEAERDAIRRRLIEVVMRPLARDAELAAALARRASSTSEADEILEQE